MSRLIRTPGQHDAMRPRGVSASGIVRGRTASGRPVYAQGSRQVRTSIAVARPITDADIPRHGSLVLVSPEPVWSFEGSKQNPQYFPPETAWKSPNGRMREASGYAGRKSVAAEMARQRSAGLPDGLPSDSSWADVVSVYRRKPESGGPRTK